MKLIDWKVSPMEFIDWKLSPGRAFATGFLKGLGAPALLYADFAPPPVPAVAMPESIRTSPMSDAQKLAGDWAAIGGDLAKVIALHAPEA